MSIIGMNKLVALTLFSVISLIPLVASKAQSAEELIINKEIG